MGVFFNCFNFFKQNAIKVLLICGFLCFGLKTQAAVYYFSSLSGSDDYTIDQARHAKTPWKSIDKLNSMFGILSAGDSVLFKRGDVFENAINISRSGAPFAPIYLGAYGKGSKPIISGLVELKLWAMVSDGIYESPCNSKSANLVLNGTQQAMGRYPNKGYLSYSEHDGNNAITDTKTQPAINFTGAEVVIRKNRWVIDRSTITDQTNGKISYTAGTKDMPTNGYGYFIQNSVKTLDQFGEWFYDEANKKMLVYFGSKMPAAFQVRASAVNTLVNINKRNYITIENLEFVGAGQNAFDIKNSSNITISNCNIDNTGGTAIEASYTPFITLKNLLINHSLNAAVNFDMGCTYASVLNNEIKNTGLMAGMGKSGTGTYEAITAFGDNTQIEKNHIDSTGYDGIYFGGNSSVAKNNFVDYFCLVKDDGAGIYIGDWSKTINKKVIGNIVLHGIGAGEGSNYPSSMQAEGIYVDDNTEGLIVTGNTVSLCANNGIKVHNAKDIKICNNTVFNNGVQLRMEQDHYIATSTYIRNNSVTNNIFFSKNNHQPNAKYSTQLDDISSFGKIDSNFYCRPDDSAEIRTTTVRNGKDVYKTYDLNDWKPAYNQDNVSTKTVRKLSTSKNSDSYILFEYNASNLEKIISLSKPYLDVHNHVYKDKVVLSPYSSVLLVAADTKAKKPVPVLLASR